VAVAQELVEMGARWVHVVDLDGSRAGEPVQAEVVRRLCRTVTGRARVEVAGGLRTAWAVRAALDGGASRVVIGTAALEDAALMRALLDRHGPDTVAVAIDVRDGLAVGQGWRDGAPGRPYRNVVRELSDRGVEWFVVTAIERDGMLEGPDVALLAEIVELGAGRVIASGGFASVDDLIRVRDAGCGGAIVGRAIYEGRIDLRSALEAISRP
jgi:phosphoribosylformimino-5-aminoimidazole carboxamide ribotide isomerase